MRYVTCPTRWRSGHKCSCRRCGGKGSWGVRPPALSPLAGYGFGRPLARSRRSCLDVLLRSDFCAAGGRRW